MFFFFKFPARKNSAFGKEIFLAIWCQLLEIAVTLLWLPWNEFCFSWRRLSECAERITAVIFSGMEMSFHIIFLHLKTTNIYLIAISRDINRRNDAPRNYHDFKLQKLFNQLIFYTELVLNLFSSTLKTLSPKKMRLDLKIDLCCAG